MSRFGQRSSQKEMMDDLQFSGEELRQTLNELKTVNKLLGGNKVLTDGLSKFVEKYPKTHYHIADVGCGGGDMVKVMAKWAEKNRLQVTFHALDANPHIITLAKENLKEYPNVHFHTADVFEADYGVEKLDIITCTLFTHHFTDPQLVEMLKNFRKNAHLGLVINDLHRHPLAYHSIKFITRLFSKSEMVKNDGPISVLRSFTYRDLQFILQEAGWEQHQIKWNWAFRWQVLGFNEQKIQ
jgi:2-polyprenyl-3-methyl-5-hydroxy-6-metoxy-1,4-benzoquinol methylase